MMRHDSVLKLNQKPHTIFGIASFIMAMVSLVLVLMTIVLSAAPNGIDDSKKILIGVLEWISAMLTISGFGVAVIGEGDIEMERIFVHISLVIHFVGLIYHGFVIWYGFIA